MKFIIVILLLGVLSFFMTFLIRRFALRKGWISLPNERSLHDIPTPHGGGVAIVISWYIGITFLYFSGIIEREFFFALLCGILLAVVSLVNDYLNIRPWIRLIFHFISAVGAFYFLGGLRPLIIPGININYPLLIYPLAIVGMVWFINLFNFMDGVDGFASVQAIIICAVAFIFTWDLSTILLIVCITGFLYWNWPKAKIFMGDVGSTQLGFILVVSGIYFHNIVEFSIMNWIMLASPFWFDATLTLFRRMINRENLGEAHRKHAYQRIVRAGLSHEKVNIFLIIINLVNIGLISVYRAEKHLQISLFIFTLLFYYLITLYVDRKLPFNKD
ncbi:MAG: glycosyltransferase family 4 protein [Bacteroidota bacterium]